MTLGRHYFVVVVFVVCALIGLAKVFWLSLVESEFLQAQGSDRTERTQAIPATRGVIFDRRGEPLSVSTPLVSIWVDPLTQSLTAADLNQLAKVLRISAPSIQARLRANKERRFLYIVRRITPEVARQVRSLNMSDLRFDTEYKRYYPMGEVTAHVIGLTNINNQGLEGFELTANRLLQGTPGERRIVRDLQGRGIRDAEYRRLPKFGSDQFLTLDARIQHQAFKELRDVVSSYEAESGTVILVDVPTGEVLALANYPSYNPNDGSDRDFANMRNRAVSDLFEPGSTLKPFLAIAALESGLFTAQSEIRTSPGYIRVSGKRIEDPRDYGTLTLKNVLVKSSQVGASKIAMQLPPNAMLDVLIRAGFAEYAMSGLPGESMATLPADDLDGTITRVTMAYGYGLSVTPMALARGFLAIASGGVLRQIKVARNVQSVDDMRVFKRAHADDVLDMLEGVVGPTGTAHAASMPAFRVAGKTGTVRKIVAGGYSDQHHVVLFVGMLPVDDPQLLGVVVIDDPKGERVSGGSVAAPLFSRIVLRAMQIRGYQTNPKGPTREKGLGNAA